MLLISYIVHTKLHISNFLKIHFLEDYFINKGPQNQILLKKVISFRYFFFNEVSTQLKAMKAEFVVQIFKHGPSLSLQQLFSPSISLNEFSK